MAVLNRRAVAAIVTAAATGVAGTAFAFLTTAGIGQDVAATAGLEDSRDLRLELEDPASVGDPRVFGGRLRLKVVAYNTTDTPLRIVDPNQLTPVMTLPLECPEGSFEIRGVQVRNVDVPPGEELPTVVGSFRLVFVELPEEQIACTDAEILFTWE